MNELKFYTCKTCGNMITKVKDSGVPVVCCGAKMEEMVPGSVDASVEKHVPAFEIEGNKVYVVVGEVEHPMVEEHYIEWITIQTSAGIQTKHLLPSDKPAASFSITEQEELVAVYAYCNLHGLWKADHVITPVCDLEPVTVDTNENYLVCKCNKVNYFDILDTAKNANELQSLLSVFDVVKNTTHCSTGCGGCYNKVIAILSEVMSGKVQ